MHHGRPYKRRFDVAPRQEGNGSSTSVGAGNVNTTSSTSATVSTSISLSSGVVTETSSSSVLSNQTSQTLTTPSTTSSSGQVSSSQASSTESGTLSTEKTTPTISTTTSSSRSVLRSSTPVPSNTSANSSSASIETSTTSASISTPPTTFIITAGPPSDTPTSIIGTYTFSPSATKEPASGLVNGFWQNTGAVAGTFTALGVFVLGIIAAFIILRRRRARRTQSEDEFFENFAVTSGSMARDSAQAASSHGHTMSPHSSFAELAAQAPMDVYSENNMYNIHYGPGYPSGTSHGFAPVDGGANTYPNDSSLQMNQQPSYPIASEAQPQSHYILPPARAVHDQQQAAPRRSYQRSIDSFYGAS